MRIENLSINNLRVIRDLLIIPSKKINLITGRNGSGKTTLLEAIYLLARNRSFRTTNNSSLIHNAAKELVVTARMVKDDGHRIQTGLKKTGKLTELHIAGKKHKRVSDQARMIPIGIITAHSQKLLTEAPSVRRKFLNWGVFHVEQNYAQLINNYNKVLNQRNAALRRSQKNYRIWDKQLIHIGLTIHQVRKRYLQQLISNIFELIQNIDEFSHIEIKYKKGWNDDKSLMEEIQERNDEVIKYTYAGPHRADLDICIDEKPIESFLSSGQLKMLSIILILAQLKTLRKINRETPILLFDDFQSELDAENRSRSLTLIKQLHCQAFMTSIDTDESFTDEVETKVFHVEHGQIV